MKRGEGDLKSAQTKCLAGSSSISYDEISRTLTLFTSLHKVTPALALPPDNHFTLIRLFGF
ncbi:MAG TPA: hypothetical protein DC054_00790 [Blastocatellia bacterium]|nr:hypothetical protein [Blastocatellia bacterium]